MTKPKREKKRKKSGGAIVDVSPALASVAYDGEDLSQWSDAELIRGKRADKGGQFRGRPPEWYPAAIVRELTARRFSRFHLLLTEKLEDAVEVLASVILDEDVAPSDRLRAIELLCDRVMGKPRESVHIGLTPTPQDDAPWRKVLATAIVGTLEQAKELEAQASGPNVIDVTPEPEPEEPDDGELVEEFRDDVTGETWRFLDSRTPQRSRS